MFLIGIVVFILAIAAGAASKRRRVSYGSHYESHRNWDNDDEDYKREARHRERDYEREAHHRERDDERQRRREEREYAQQRRRDEQESRRQEKLWTDSWKDSGDYANNFFGGGGTRRRSRNNWGF